MAARAWRVRCGAPALAAMLLACNDERAPSPAWVRREAGEHLLDVAADGRALVGRVLPAPADGDADRLLAVRILLPGGAPGTRFDEAVTEARFVPRSGALVLVSAAHVLVRVTGTGAPETLDRDVYGPLSFALDGRRLAYTRGEPPFLVAVLRDLATGHAEVLAPELRSVWCPVLSHDGRELLVVASVDGAPAWWRLRPGGRASRWELPAGTVFPTGPAAPVLLGDAVVFEDEAGLHALGLDGRLRRSLPGVHGPVRLPDATAVLVEAPGDPARTLRLDALDLRGEGR